MKYLIFIFLMFTSFNAYSQTKSTPVLFESMPQTNHKEIILKEKNDMKTSEFKVFGLVTKEKIFTESDLLQLKQDSIGTVYIKNHKGDIVINAKDMKGVLLKTILDSTGILSKNYKNYNQFYFVLTAADGYKNIYSWNEIYNNEIGNHVYIITEKNDKNLNQLPEKILVLSANDIYGGGRYLKSLSYIEIKAIDEIK